MVRPLVRYGAAGLNEPSAPVAALTSEIEALITDMIDTMHAAPGIGLAAPQIGVPLRVAVIDLSVGRRQGELITLINPEFLAREGMQVEDEGCLSIPGFTASVARPAKAVVAALDRHWQPVTVEGTGLLARALQHELDHLDGTLFLGRLRGVKRALMHRQIAARRRIQGW